MVVPISINNTSADSRYTTDYTIVFDVMCDSRMNNPFDISFFYNRSQYQGSWYQERYIGFESASGQHKYAFTNSAVTTPAAGVLHPFASTKGYYTYDPTNANDVSIKSFIDIGHLSVVDGLKKRITLVAAADPNNPIHALAQSLTIL